MFSRPEAQPPVSSGGQVTGTLAVLPLIFTFTGRPMVGPTVSAPPGPPGPPPPGLVTVSQLPPTSSIWSALTVSAPVPQSI